MKRWLFGVLGVPLLASCGGGGTATPSALPAAIGAPLSAQSAAQTPGETQSSAVRMLQPNSTTSAGGRLYVANTGNNSITVYPQTASGGSAPLYVIAGAKTGISRLGQLSEDAQGNLYVAAGAAILVFKHGASGDVAPIRRLAGPATGLHNVLALTVDEVTGKIFAVDSVSLAEFVYSSLLRFPPNAAGNTAPFARSAATLYPAVQIASDSTGQKIIEAHSTVGPNGFEFGIDTVAKQFPNGASLQDLFSVSNFQSNGIADDPAAKTYLATTYSAGIYRLQENTQGVWPSLAPPVVSVITSDTCGGQIALDPQRNIYVTHAAVSGVYGCTASDAVSVYEHDASGDARPLRVLSGRETKLSAPSGVYEGT